MKTIYQMNDTDIDQHLVHLYDQSLRQGDYHTVSYSSSIEQDWNRQFID